MECKSSISQADMTFILTVSQDDTSCRVRHDHISPGHLLCTYEEIREEEEPYHPIHS